MSFEHGAFSLGEVGGGGPAVLCLHGLRGTPREVRPLGEALMQRGFACLGPYLPGHGETPQKLAATPYQAWTELGLQEYDRLREAHSRVYVLGFSMGGVVALHLCQHREVPAAVVLAAPLRLQRHLEWLIPLVSRWLPFRRGPSDLRDPEALANHQAYDVMPLLAVRQMLKMARLVHDKLAHIRTPLQLLYSRRDRVVPLHNAELIRAGVESSVCRLDYLDESGHIMALDLERTRVAQICCDFLTQEEQKRQD